MDNNKKLYTLLIYTENMVGMLSQVTAVFTRRQVNIESINASASSIEGVHKYTITTWSDEEQVKTITKQIEKKVDVIKADYYTDDQIFIREDALFKLSTPVVMENPEISKIIRRADAQIIEVNPTFCTTGICPSAVYGTDNGCCSETVFPVRMLCLLMPEQSELIIYFFSYLCILKFKCYPESIQSPFLTKVYLLISFD